ncbi:hypothetical protein [Thermococcus sp.]|uniref:hypothetical protein n=1 Tax=Thermococcus sp. TaxID=35749 RepID=UPI002624EA85|nr:hypothetical protein [Thermococcus sp.]
MKVGKLMGELDKAIAHLEVALVANQQRIFESPYTSYEFAQRALEIEEDLNDLKKLREELSKLDPESEIEEHYPEKDVERLLKLLELLERSNAHLY